MEFQEIAAKARSIREKYAAYEQKKFGRSWTPEELTLGFVGDVGDLAKLVQANNGIRDIPEARARLEHELADCLWSVCALADAHGIDLEQAFVKSMSELEGLLAKG
jgi:NTP pyrophosphatase (non-canonical NTP hydrolase)